jgi:membrane associated rhomboid family serine protease
MPRSTPITLALPPFTGATRRLVLISVVVFFAEALLQWILPSRLFALFGFLNLIPYDLFHGMLWQLVTFSFMPQGTIATLFTLIFLWFIGSMLEGLRGSRWLYEIFFTSAIGGGLLASAIASTHVFRLSELSIGLSPYAGLYGLLIAVYVLMGEAEFRFFFLIRIKAKYMVAIYILIDLAFLLKDSAFSALLELSGALCGYLFLRVAARRGLTYAFSERWYALRNSYYRAKRRSAARKFEVYMGKQGRSVKFDRNGRYIDPDKDPNDKRWMN